MTKHTNLLIRFDQWYKVFGLRRRIDFVKPKIINLEELTFPFGSIFHYYSDSKLHPSRSIPEFKNITEGYIIPELEYLVELIAPGEKPKDNKPVVEDTRFSNKCHFRKKNFNPKAEVKKIKKEDADFITVFKDLYWKRFDSRPRLLERGYLIEDYSYIHDHYVYREGPLVEWCKAKNLNYSIVENMKEIRERATSKGVYTFQHFYILRLPSVFYGYNLIKKWMYREFDNQAMNLFYDYWRITLLDFFKSLRLETVKDSPINLIKKVNELKHINIVFKLDDKGIIVNLYHLLGFNKEYTSIDAGSSPFDPDVFVKAVHHLLHSLYVLPSFSPKDIIRGHYDEKLSEILDMKDNEENTVDKLVESLKSKDKKKVLVDDIEDEDVIEDETDVEKLLEEENDTEDEVRGEVYKRLYENPKEEVLASKDDPLLYLDKKIKELSENEIINKQRERTLRKAAEAFLEEKDPFGGKEKIKDLLKIKPEDIEIKEEETKLPKANVVFDEKDAADTINVLDKKYITKTYKKDMVRVIAAIQNAGYIVKDYKVNKEKDILGEYEEHEITYLDPLKNTHTVKLKIPTVDEDGVYMISGNKYRLRKQRADVPIKKIAWNRVSLSSAYNKVFVTKADVASKNRGFGIKRQLLKLKEANKINNLVLGGTDVPDTKLPIDYTLFMRYIKSFNIKQHLLSFNYPNRENLLDKTGYKLDEVEKDGKVLVGRKGKTPVVIDDNGILYYYEGKGKYKEIGNIYDFIGIDTSKLIEEFAIVNLFKNKVPVGILLWYYLGLDGMIKLLDGVKVERLPGNKIIKDKSKIIVKTATDTIIFDTDNPTYRMILNGINDWKKIIRKVPTTVLENKETFKGVFKEAGLPLNTVTEIDLLETLFVDPVTANILSQLGEPTTFIGLLVRAAEMLVDDYYMDQQSMKGYLIKGYERIPQMAYMMLTEAIRKKENEDFFGRGKLKVDPYSVWRVLNEDSTSILLDDLNPITFLKQKEDVTYLGLGGRKKESMSARTRVYHKDDIGVISEAHKDSGDVGITAYMSANPVLKNVRGMKKDIPVPKLNFSNILSTSAMLAPFATYDDSKRLDISLPMEKSIA